MTKGFTYKDFFKAFEEPKEKKCNCGCSTLKENDEKLRTFINDYRDEIVEKYKSIYPNISRNNTTVEMVDSNGKKMIQFHTVVESDEDDYNYLEMTNTLSIPEEFYDNSFTKKYENYKAADKKCCENKKENRELYNYYVEFKKKMLPYFEDDINGVTIDDIKVKILNEGTNPCYQVYVEKPNYKASIIINDCMIEDIMEDYDDEEDEKEVECPIKLVDKQPAKTDETYEAFRDRLMNDLVKALENDFWIF